MRTYTPTLDRAVLARLKQYAHLFSPALRRKGYLDWAYVFLVGLLQDGDRKSVEPLVERVLWLSECVGEDPVQAAWHWLSKGKWDDQELFRIYRDEFRRSCDEPESVFIFDDTSFPKKGDHSVGVAHQYCGSLGKRANCQVAVSLHYVTRLGHHPLSMRLHLPQSWTGDPKRLKLARVPEEHSVYKTKPEIALELLDQAIAEGHQARFVVADAGYGSSTEFRGELEKRKLVYAVGVRGEAVAFSAQPCWIYPGDASLPPNQMNPRLAPDSAKPRSLNDLAKSLRFQRCTWRAGTKTKLTGRFARTRVWPAKDWQSGACAATEPIWLIVEKRGDELRFAFSNASADISLVRLVRLLKSRWPVEQGYQQLKEELGLDHFEGRSWVGLHHHICMTVLAYGFLELERRRLSRSKNRGTARATNNAQKKLNCPPYPQSDARCSESC